MNYNTVMLIDSTPTITITGPSWAPGTWVFPELQAPTGVERVLPGPKVTKAKIKPKSELSWKTVKDMGLIKMTPYSVVDEMDEYFTVSEIHKRHFYDRPVFIQGDNRRIDPITSMTTTWLETKSIFDFKHLPFRDLFSELEEEVRLEKNALKADVVNQSFSGFDALTQMAELKESYELVLALLKAAVNPVRGVRNLLLEYKKRKPSKPLRFHSDLTSQWMQYRYGIMPLVLGIQDALKLIQEYEAKYKTDRSRTIVSPPRAEFTDQDFLYQEISGQVKLNATAKSKYSAPRDRLLDLLNFNPLLTAWEMIPLSFVIDWFVNVGDVIMSRTGPLRDLSEQRQFCISERAELKIDTFVYYKYETGALWTQFRDFPGYSQRDQIDTRETFRLHSRLHSRKINNYTRTLFQPQEVEFKLNPTLTWRRWLDAYVLSLNILLPLLRGKRT